jgi:hypothetical protein
VITALDAREGGHRDAGLLGDLAEGQVLAASLGRYLSAKFVRVE